MDHVQCGEGSYAANPNTLDLSCYSPLGEGDRDHDEKQNEGGKGIIFKNRRTASDLVAGY